MIKVRTMLDLDQLKKYNKFLRNSNWSKSTDIIFFVILTLVEVLSLYMLIADGNTLVIPELIMIPVIGGLLILVRYILPNITIKKTNMIGTEVTYTFGESSFELITRNTNINETGTIGYGKFIRIAETKDCFYLFINKIQAYIVDKSGFLQGDADGLREILIRTVPAKKYKRYN